MRQTVQRLKEEEEWDKRNNDLKRRRNETNGTKTLRGGGMRQTVQRLKEEEEWDKRNNDCWLTLERYGGFDRGEHVSIM